MNSKADLKAAREAIGKKEFKEAVKACKRVLLWEGENYNAWVFLGVAYTNLEEDKEAEEAYKRAIEINSDNMLGWQGLVSFYEKRQKTEQLISLIQKLIPRVIAANDNKKLVEYLKKLLAIYKEKGEQVKYLDILKEYFLPGSPYYDSVKDQPDLPDQKEIWLLIITQLEKQQQQQIDNEVASRRFSVKGGTQAQILSQVEADVYGVSKLGGMYQTLLDLISKDDLEREEWELKLFRFNSKRLLGLKDKSKLYEELIEQAKQLVSSNDPLPLQILIESANVDSPEKYDWDLINDLINRFPTFGLSKLAQGYTLYKEGDIDGAFDLLSDGLDTESVFGYLCVSWIYFESKEYATGLEYASRGKDWVKKIKIEQGVSKNNALASFETCMAHCYRLLDKKYNMDAMALYKSVLEFNPDHKEALEGAGLILIDEKRFEEAFKNFQKVYQLDSTQHKALAEMGWIDAQKKEYKSAIQYLLKALETAGMDVAEYYYRLGRIYWSMEDHNEALKYLMQAVKTDPYYASGFTYLGHYYREFKKDHTRARKCYQKAYVLDPLDTDAAQYLTNYLIQENQTAEAEAIIRQITVVSPKTGWAWRRMGYTNMGLLSYNEAITCFQKGLRADTSDVSCWEGLAEAYSRAGRFVAALKAFDRATQLNPQSIHAHNERSYVQQKIGLLDESIAGFKHTLALAEAQGQPGYVPALVGLTETYLERAREDYQMGFFGRASDGCSRVFETALIGLNQDESIVALWKAVGDASAFYRNIPTYSPHYRHLQSLMAMAQASHETLKFEADISQHWVTELLGLGEIEDGFELPQTTALDLALSCAIYAYKQAIVICRNHRSIAPGFWHDLALLYHHLNDPAQIRSIQLALSLEPHQAMYWNTLGLICLLDQPRLAQHSFIRSIESNPRSAIPWTNYGFLCLLMKDFGLAQAAFETAHALDPEWISAWVGQAYVASVWGDDAASLFEHAFESSHGTDASYGYALSMFERSGEGVMPVFALEKLVQKKAGDAVGLNLLGLWLERLGQFERAAEAFASAILVLNGRIEEGEVIEERLRKAHANLGRVLCAMGDFEGAIQTLGEPATVYAQLNAGIAYYFLDRLPESLSMFELALDQQDLRQDVVVLLSKVLWALGGEEQRSVAKDQLFSR